MQSIAQRSLETEQGKARLEKVEKMKPIAEKLGCSLAQLAIAWYVVELLDPLRSTSLTQITSPGSPKNRTVKNPNVSTTILGASKPEQVVENVKSLDVVPKLTDDILAQLDEILGNKPVPPPAHYKR